MTNQTRYYQEGELVVICKRCREVYPNDMWDGKCCCGCTETYLSVKEAFSLNHKNQTSQLYLSQNSCDVFHTPYWFNIVLKSLYAVTLIVYLIVHILYFSQESTQNYINNVYSHNGKSFSVVFTYYCEYFFSWVICAYLLVFAIFRNEYNDRAFYIIERIIGLALILILIYSLIYLMVAAIVFAIWCAGLKTGAESSQTKEKYLIFIQFYFMCAKAECRDILDERRIKK